MSEPALRIVPSVNLDEFERRLRATGSLGGVQEDPLAELARLLGVEEPTAKRAEPAEAAAPPPPPPPPVRESAPPRLSTVPPVADRADVSLGHIVNVDFGGGTSEAAAKTPPALPASQAAPRSEAVPPELPAAAVSEPEHEPAASHFEETLPRRRSYRRVGVIAALVIVGAAGGALALVYKGGVPGLHNRLPPFIMAATGPTKIQPPSQETVSSQDDVASLLMKDRQSKPGSVNVVSNQEAPVDLQQQTKAQANASAPAAAAADAPASPPAIAPAPLVVVAAPSPAPSTATAPSPAPSTATPPAAAPSPPVAPPAQASAAAKPDASVASVGSTAAPPAVPAPFPEPKRVKTVSVRPDGSVIASNGAASAEAPPPVAAPQPVSPPPVAVSHPTADAAEPATPKLDLPPKPSAKSTARVPIAKIDTTAAGATSQSPEAPLQISPTVQRQTAAKSRGVNAPPPAPAPDPATAAPSSPSSPRDRAETATPLRTATAEPTAPAAPAAAASGNYAVQLAAPGSEEEAQSTSTRLQAKYQAELGGRQLTIHKAESKGHSVYRVRTDPLSHADAIALCEKLKASGGNCFLARE